MNITNTLSKVFISIGIALFFLGFTLGIGYIASQVKIASGSVSVTDEYIATTTSSMHAGVVIATKQQRVVLSNRGGTLGSLVVGSTSPATLVNAPIKIWDATSTLDLASTTVSILSASSANGTYTYDVVLNRGLIVELPVGFFSDIVITYRNN